ncbi:DUF362 domain-containing protein [Thermosulfuriphilus ammonigenes]|uniref:DUF362 domain-containing protein n=1 Tax=Thermosulfuriphilus ammonigenes TaxID=1936021 RepID=A0A6G7PTV2_9BACT|nr:DUF362 domain-containing protein [Thermosulfuriphilus ammonigenes]MBA2848753.1 hypothetical protein [Thermosulfuriphilus ammonigenes]QIJ71114.1 DUF362 domain-containing protein [Thermosulfuriphilus ammonigenes]
MASKVYFVDLRANPRLNLLDKTALLLEKLGIREVIRPSRQVGIKIHFGERGNLAFIRPQYVRRVVDLLKELGASPFLTDTNTLYKGSRSDAVVHLETAIENGFDFAVVRAPIIIADGLLGDNFVRLEVDFPLLKELFIAQAIYRADALVVMSHVKGHELSGFGGAIKNLGMGCAARKGKLAQHSTIAPKVNKKKCVFCKTCLEYCPSGAIAPGPTGKRMVIEPQKCIGCGECIAICPSGAIQVQWNEVGPVFLKKLAEYAKGALWGKADRALFLNFIMNVSPACDCYHFNDYPFVRDIGILASRDPVAIDQASVDLINQEMALPGSALTRNVSPGEDKLRGLYPKVDWEIQLDHAEEIGLGSRQYQLERL